MGNIDVLSILVNVFFAIIGGAISWTIARSTTLKTELSVIVNSATIFKDEIFPGIAIEVNGQNSKVLTKSEVILWNSGFTTVSPKNKIHIKEWVRKLLRVGGMFIYEAVIVFWGVLTIVLLLERLDVIALLLGLGICLCGGGLSGMVFRILQRHIFMEDGPPTLWL